MTGTLAKGEFTQTRRPVPQLPTGAPTADVPPERPGSGNEKQLLQLQKELTSLRGLPILKSWTERGYLFIDVVYDDGSLQRELDSKYGRNLVVIVSALKPVT